MRLSSVLHYSPLALLALIGCGSASTDASRSEEAPPGDCGEAGCDSAGADAGTAGDCGEITDVCQRGAHYACRDGRLIPEPCAAGKACEASDPACVDVVCTPGESRCTDGSTSETCNAIGTKFTSLSCTSTQGCDPQTGLCAECVCAPGSRAATCPNADHESRCLPGCLGYVNVACGDAQTCVAGACSICTPGAKRCIDEGTSDTCNETGTAWEGAHTCGALDVCYGTDGCITRCDAATREPSTVGCSFLALNMDTYYEDYTDGVTLMNPNEAISATVEIFDSVGGIVKILDHTTVPPLGTYTFAMPNTADVRIDGTSALRWGGSFHIESDLPIHAHMHAPLDRGRGNTDSSCLLPESALGTEYVVGSYTALSSYSSYLSVVATADALVTVTVPDATIAGPGVPSMGAGTSRKFSMQRYDTLQIATDKDITGAWITSTAPIAVFGAVACAQVPLGTSFCDHLEEQMLPVQNLGKSYFLAPYAKRSDNDAFRWRVVATEDDTVITQTPAVAAFPASLAKGAFFEFETLATAEGGGSVLLTSDKRFAVFQYTRGNAAGGAANSGDPAMGTVIPTEQFIRQTFVSVPASTNNAEPRWIQIVRSGNDEVSIDGEAIDAAAFTTSGTFAFANISVSPGVHQVVGAGPIGVSIFTIEAVNADAFPATMALRPIDP
jgi:hypothetical protein